jgi:hypothetical protein
MHPFVRLMRTYCIDYTNAHNQGLYDELMEPDYVLHMMGFTLDGRDTSYAPAVTRLYREYPGLGLQVHEFLLNGDRLCMRFSEHGASLDHDGHLAAWRGIGLYKWNGIRLVENYVEQDYHGRNRQLATGVPDPLEPPHLDPWVATEPVPEDSSVLESARRWLAAGDWSAADAVIVDDSDVTGAVAHVLDVEEVTINDLFSAGSRFAFHVTLTGPYAGGLDGVGQDAIGTTAALAVAGVAEVADDRVRNVRAVTGRLGTVIALTGRLPT